MTGQLDRPDVPSPPWDTHRKTVAPPRKPLSLDRIVKAAIEVIDSEGSSAVTMRRIAGDLGVVPSALYLHVRKRQDLLNLALEYVLETDVGMPESTGDWQADLKRYFLRLQAGLSAHGDIAFFNFAAFPPTQIGVATTERLLSMLLDAGISTRTAAWGLHRITLYTTADVFEGWQMRSRDMEAWTEPVRTYLSELPPKQFPAITSSLDALLDEDSDGRFEIGIDFLIAGIANAATAS